MTDPILPVGLAGPGLSPNRATPVGETEKMRQTAQEFEAMFLGLLLKSMRGSSGTGGVGADSQDTQTYRDMLDQEVGRSVAKSGGIGLARMILADQMRRSEKAPGPAGMAEGAAAMAETPPPGKKVLKSPGKAVDTSSDGLIPVENGRLP
jgi:peptidoglycan hydrolase FlgJ